MGLFLSMKRQFLSKKQLIGSGCYVKPLSVACDRWSEIFRYSRRRGSLKILGSSVSELFPPSHAAKLKVRL